MPERWATLPEAIKYVMRKWGYSEKEAKRILWKGFGEGKIETADSHEILEGHVLDLLAQNKTSLCSEESEVIDVVDALAVKGLVKIGKTTTCPCCLSLSANIVTLTAAGRRAMKNRHKKKPRRSGAKSSPRVHH
jgi:hypothetical protein